MSKVSRICILVVIVQHRGEGLDGEISTFAAGREGSCLAALQRLNDEGVDICWQVRGNNKRTRGHGINRCEASASTLDRVVLLYARKYMYDCCEIGDWHMYLGRSVLALPALIEVTSAQGLPVAESKQAWKKTTLELPHTILRSINPLPTTSVVTHGTVTVRLVAVIIKFPLDRCTSITIKIVLRPQQTSSVRFVPTHPPPTCIQKHYPPWP